MELKRIDFNDFKIGDLVEIKESFFKNYAFEKDVVFESVKKYINYYESKNMLPECMNGLGAIVCYLLCSNVLKKNEYSLLLFDDIIRFKNATISSFSNYISPFSIVDFPIVINGNFNYIGGGYHIYNNIVIANHVMFYDNNNHVFDNITQVGEKSIFDDDCKIYCEIGKNCHVKTGCVIREKIPDNGVVELKNVLQVKSVKTESYLPSQTLSFFGCVPKYKDSLVIYGEGFYNPKVKIIVPYGKLTFDIKYWDKDKIILKFKKAELGEDTNKCTIVVFSNGQRISIINDIGALKLLKTLKK